MKNAIFYLQPQILDPPSSILDPRSSILDPRSSDLLLVTTPNRIAVFGAKG